jgi:autotransporter-associated beta strand protein
MDMEFSDLTTIAGNGTANLTLSGALAGANGFTFDSSTYTLTLAGARANGYGGSTTVNSGDVVLNKNRSGLTAVTGDLRSH